MKLSIKIALIFTLLSFFSIATASMIAFDKGRTIIQQNTASHLSSTNDQKAAAFNQWVDTRKKFLESIAGTTIIRHAGFWDPKDQSASPGIKAEETDQIRNCLTPYTRGNIFNELFVVGLNSGRVLVSTDPVQEGKYKDGQAFFLHGQTQTYVQSILFDVAAQSPTMIFSTPLPSLEGRPKALLAASMNLHSLSDIFQQLNPRSRSEDTYLVNKFNYFITEPRFGKNYALKKSITTTPVEASRKNGRYLGLHKDYRGVRVIGEARWLEDHQLVLITEIDEAEMLAPIKRLRQETIFLMIAICMASAGLGWLLASTITKPLETLKDAAARIGSGDLNVQIDSGKSAEINALANAFMSMAQDLDSTMVSKEKLEKEVQSRKVVQDQLKQTVVSLKQSNEDLQQFAYVASHDLQEPLRMVSSFTQLLASRYSDALDDQAKKWIHFAVDGAERMQRLIQDLLSFSRVNTHGQGFECIEMEKALKEALENIEAAITETGARISATGLPEVKADHTQMVQLFQNLISNAIKFCRNGTPRIEISAERESNEWRFSIKDNGIGIEKEFAEKIFIIFQRLHTRRDYPGTGLGLAVCKRILQRHGGRIWVESEQGEGATFFFTLPD